MRFDPTKEKALEDLITQRDEEYYKFLMDRQELINECEDLKSKCDARIANINSERSLLRREIDELYNFLIKFGDIGDKISIFEYTFEDFINIPHFNTIQKKSKNPQIKHAGFFDYYLYGVGAIVKHFQNRKTFLEEKENFEKEKLSWTGELLSIEAYKLFLEDASKIAELYFKTLIVIKELIYYTIIPELEGVQSFLYAQAAKDIIISNEAITVLTPSKISRFKGSKKYNKHYTFIKNAHDYYCLITEFFKTPVFTNLLSKFESNTLKFDKDFEEFQKSIKPIEDLKEKLLDNSVFSNKTLAINKKKTKTKK